MTARLMSTFTDRLGACVHMTFPAYRNQVAQVQKALDWLGITHVRDRGTVGCMSLTGVGVDVICYTAADAKAAVAAGAESIEGPNEPNSRTGWETSTRTAWDAICPAVGGAVPLWTPGMNQIHPYDSIGPLPADFGNVHCYRNGQDLAGFTARAQHAVAGQRSLVGFRPVVVTETGWFDDTGGAQLIETLVALWSAGAERVYLYELLDESDKAGTQGHYGLFNADWSPKPVATALRNFLATYGRDDDLAALTLRPQSDASAVSLAGAQRTNAALTGQLTAMQTAFDAYRAAHPDVAPTPAPTPAPAPVTPPSPAPVPSSPTAPKVVEFSDFTQQTSGMFLGPKSLIGNGIDKSVYQMRPHSSTKASLVPTTFAVNPLRLLRIGGFSASQVYDGLELGNLTLQATDQGHLYHGIQVGYSNAVSIHDLRIVGIPGTSSSPPGETMSCELYRTKDAHLERVHIDGRDTTGKPVSASAIAYNFTTGTTVADDVVAQYAAYGFAVAMWQCSGVQVFNRCDFRFCRKAINIEQSDGGSYEFTRCDFRGLTGANYVAQVSSINGDCPVTFTDCISDGPLQVRTYTPPAPNDKQRDSAIRCIVGGRDVTGDPTKFQVTHAG